jgi:hypothetical protein
MDENRLSQRHDSVNGKDANAKVSLQPCAFYKFLIGYEGLTPATRDLARELNVDEHAPRYDDYQLFEYLKERLPLEFEDVVQDAWIEYRSAR